jgi:hypothetical protein
MKTSTKFISTILVFAILISGCASSSLFQTEPSNASVYVSGFRMGTTPYVHSDRKIAGAKTAVTFKKDGYKDLETTLKRNEQVDVWAILGGFFFMAPFLWIMKYDPIHVYELELADGVNQTISHSNNYDYMRGEDDNIIITIDSLKRSNTLPESLKEQIEGAMNINTGYNAVTRTYQSRYEMPKPSEDYDYILIYISIIEKKDLNLKGGNETRMKTAYLKDKFGELYPFIMYRSSFYISYGGSSIRYNSSLPLNKDKEMNNELVGFGMFNKREPIKLLISYNYIENSQLVIGKIEISLVQEH